MPPNFQIDIYGEIGFEVEAKAVIALINSAQERPIDLHINSAGGSVFDGYAIYNALLNHAPGVNVYVDGLAASIASYIAMAGTRVYMADNALLMIHNPSAFIGGDSEELRKQADILDKIEVSLMNAYTKRTGLPGDAILEMMDNETWLDAQTALAFGFIDEITQPLKMAAHFDKSQLSKFKNCPKQLLIMATEANENPVESAVPSGETKPSIFARITAMLKEKNDLVALVAKHDAEMKAERDEHAKTKAQLSDVAHALTEASAKVAAFEKAAEDLEATIKTLEAEKKSASQEAANIVASIGFDQTKLPAAVAADAAEQARAAAEPQTFDAWMDKYNAITDPAAKQKFLRENETKIWACRQTEKFNKLEADRNARKPQNQPAANAAK